MADEQSTTSTEETEVSVDTSVTSDDTSTEDTEDVELEDIEVSEEDIASDESTEEAEADTEETSETSDDTTEAEDSSDDTDETETEVSDEDKQKAFNKEQAEKRIQERQQRLATQKEQQQQYLAEAEDAHDLALRQLQIDAYDNKVERNANSLTNGYERAIKDFDILTSNNPEIQAEINQAIDAFQAMYVTVDAYGNPTEVRGDLYKHLQSKADSIARLTGIRAVQQGKSKAKEKSKALTTPNRAPKESKVDPDMAAFDEEANK